MVYEDRLWIMGGWFDSYVSAPRDVWSTVDSKRWNPAIIQSVTRRGFAERPNVANPSTTKIARKLLVLADLPHTIE